METVLQDIRFGIRVLLKTPGFTVVALLSLALGIGAVAAIFTVTDAALLRPMAVQEPKRLFIIQTRTAEMGAHSDFSYPLYVDYRDHNDVFTGTAAYAPSSFGISAAGRTERVRGEFVSSNYFSVLGVPPLAGHFFSGADELKGSQAVAVISYKLWKRLGGDASLVGSTVTLNARPFYVIGVAPPSFTGMVRGFEGDVWVTAPWFEVLENFPDILSSRNVSFLALFGRLKPGMNKSQAEARMTAMARSLDVSPRDEGRGQFDVVLPSAAIGDGDMVETLSYPLRLLLACVALVLAIACANVANLLLARSRLRQREIGIRLALGATPWRLMRQFLTESVLLSLLGGGVGLLLAAWVGGLCSHALISQGARLTLDSGLNLRVLGFTFAVSMLSAIVFGTLPALKAARLRGHSALHDSVDGMGRTGRGAPLRSVLVVAQVMCSIVLLVGAGLFLRSLWNLKAIDLGFAGDNVLAVSVDLSLQGYSPERAPEFYRQAVERLSAIPGVRSAAYGMALPVTTGGMRQNLRPNQTKPAVNERVEFDMDPVTPGFFQSLGLPLLRGRDFRPSDSAKSAKVVIVNERFARKFWPNSDAVGQSFATEHFGNEQSTYEVIGVAKDTKYRNLREAPRMMMYVPVSQLPTRRGSLLVRTEREPGAVAPAIRKALGEIDPGLPVFNIRSLPEHVSTSLYLDRARALLLTLLAALAAVLAGIGIYGLISYAVAQRTREIGIRMALGARPGDVVGMLMKGALKLAVAGIIAGVAVSLALARVVASQLYGVKPQDPATLAACGVGLLLLAALAVALPARRAASVDPMVALRCE